MENNQYPIRDILHKNETKYLFDENIKLMEYNDTLIVNLEGQWYNIPSYKSKKEFKKIDDNIEENEKYLMINFTCNFISDKTHKEDNTYYENSILSGDYKCCGLFISRYDTIYATPEHTGPKNRSNLIKTPGQKYSRALLNISEESNDPEEKISIAYFNLKSTRFAQASFKDSVKALFKCLIYRASKKVDYNYEGDEQESQIKFMLKTKIAIQEIKESDEENDIKSDEENDGENDIKSDEENDIKSDEENDIKSDEENDIKSDEENDIKSDGENDGEIQDNNTEIKTKENTKNRCFTQKQKKHLTKKQKNRCNLCNIYFDHYIIACDADHINEHSNGGNTEVDNGQLVCCNCHRIKNTISGYTKEEFIDHHTKMIKLHQEAIDHIKNKI